MPRSLTRPQVGQVVWYYADVTPPAPLAAMVVRSVSRTNFDLCVFAAAGTTSPALNVPFHYGTRPVAGAWCTLMRVNENVAGQWPGRADSSPPLGAGGVAT